MHTFETHGTSLGAMISDMMSGHDVITKILAKNNLIMRWMLIQRLPEEQVSYVVRRPFLRDLRDQIEILDRQILEQVNSRTERVREEEERHRNIQLEEIRKQREILDKEEPQRKRRSQAAKRARRDLILDLA